jgi:deoxyribose-phosphate aldolase
MPYTKKEVGAMLEPTWLYADLGEDLNANPLEILAGTVKKYHCRGAVVHPGDALAIYLLGCRKIISVIDFPYGRGRIRGKRLEADTVYGYRDGDGLIGLDVGLNLWALQEKNWETIGDEIATVKNECPGKEIKVICQMPFVWEYHRDLIYPLLNTLAEREVNAIKDWTTIDNFNKPIKTDTETRVRYTEYLRNLIDKHQFPLFIKIAGKVNKDNVVAFRNAGTDIFGVSTHKIAGVFEALLTA